MRHNQIVLVALFVGIASGALSGQSDQGVQQVRVQWSTAANAAVPALGQQAAAPAPGQQSVSPLTLLERRPTGGSLPRQRNPQVSADQILVQAVNAAGDVVDSHLIPDPRLVRAESPDSTGELTGEVMYRANPDFLITFPDVPDLVELRLFQPRWTGTAFVFDPIGSVSLR